VKLCKSCSYHGKPLSLQENEADQMGAKVGLKNPGVKDNREKFTMHVYRKLSVGGDGRG
jgi:hypothetical protein